MQFLTNALKYIHILIIHTILAMHNNVANSIANINIYVKLQNFIKGVYKTKSNISKIAYCLPLLRPLSLGTLKL